MRPRAPDRSVFRAIADPTRRAILDRLRAGPAPVNQLASAFAQSRPAISKHLRILREAHIVSEERHGRERLYRLEAMELQEISDWILPIAASGRRPRQFEALSGERAMANRERAGAIADVRGCDPRDGDDRRTAGSASFAPSQSLARSSAGGGRRSSTARPRIPPTCGGAALGDRKARARTARRSRSKASSSSSSHRTGWSLTWSRPGWRSRHHGQLSVGAGRGRYKADAAP